MHFHNRGVTWHCSYYKNAKWSVKLAWVWLQNWTVCGFTIMIDCFIYLAKLKFSTNWNWIFPGMTSIYGVDILRCLFCSFVSWQLTPGTYCYWQPIAYYKRGFDLFDAKNSWQNLFLEFNTYLSILDCFCLFLFGCFYPGDPYWSYISELYLNISYLALLRKCWNTFN